MSKELNTVAPKKWVADFNYIAPTLDISDGVHIGDVAIDTAGGTPTNASKRWICSLNTEGAPLWTPMMLGSGELYLKDLPLLMYSSNYVQIVQSSFPGTVSNDLNGTTVTGTNTKFLVSFNVGDSLELLTGGYVISSITSDTELEVATAITAANVNVSYNLGITTSRFELKANGDLSLTAGGPINEFSTDGTLAGDSDKAVPTEKAVKAYVDGLTTINELYLYGALNNVGLGLNVLAENTTGASNVAIGANAMPANTEGLANVAVGEQTLYSNTTGGLNVAIGITALNSNIAGSENVAIGYGPSYANTVGTDNIAIGTQPLYFNDAGNHNVAIGYTALYRALGDNNVGVGRETLYNALGSGNVALGGFAGKYETGSDTFYIDNQDRTDLATARLSSLMYGTFNADPAAQTLVINASINGLQFGDGAANDVGTTVVGYQSMMLNTNGLDNTAIGYLAMLSNTDGSRNVAVGSLALRNNLYGNDNIGIGYAAGSLNEYGYSNISIGYKANFSNLVGNNCISIGVEALYSNGGDSNTAIGFQSIYNNLTGTNNVAIGANSLRTITDGYNNVSIGDNSLYNTTGTGNVAIGYYAGFRETGSNTFYVDNLDRTSEALGRTGSLIYGTFDADPANQTLAINAAVTASYGMNLPTGYTYNVNNVDILSSAIKRWTDNYAGVMPTIDISDGVLNGDIAVDSSITPTKVWRCLDNTESAPFWREVDLTYNTAFGPSILSPQDLLHLRGNDSTPDEYDITHNNILIEAPTGGDAGLMIGDEVSGMRWYWQNYRNEESDFIYLWNQLGQRDVLSINTGGRVGINKPSDVMEYHSWYVNPATGALNDMDVSGQYTSRLSAQYEVKIAAAGGLDTFYWRKSLDDGATWSAYSTPVDITGTEQLLEKGLSVTFGATTGHNTNDVWRWQAFSQLPAGSLIVTPAKYHEINYTADYTAETPAWTDVTYQMSWTAADSIDMPPTGTKSAIYIGDNGYYNTIYFVVAAAAAGMTMQAEYWNGTVWEILDSSNMFTDGTNSLTTSGILRWDKATMSNWAKTIPPGHGTDANYNLYWIRIVSTTNVTAAATIDLVSLHGATRFAVMAGHLDTVPAFHVDVEGRTSIGTKLATGNNQLQVVYPPRSSPSLTSLASIVEFDSADSSRSALAIRLSQSTATGVSRISLAKSRGTLEIPTNLTSGDDIGGVRYGSYANSTFGVTAGVYGRYTGNGTTQYGELHMRLNNNSTDVETVVRIARNVATGNGILQMMNNTTAVGAAIEEFSIDGTMAGNSDLAVPTEKAVVTYTAAEIAKPKWAITAAQTNTYAIQTTDCVVVCDTTTNAFSATLPTAVGVTGKIYVIKRISAGTNRLTVATTSAQTIDGITTAILDGQWNSITVCSDGANWYIL